MIRPAVDAAEWGRNPLYRIRFCRDGRSSLTLLRNLLLHIIVFIIFVIIATCSCVAIANLPCVRDMIPQLLDNETMEAAQSPRRSNIVQTTAFFRALS